MMKTLRVLDVEIIRRAPITVEYTDGMSPYHLDVQIFRRAIPVTFTSVLTPYVWLRC